MAILGIFFVMKFLVVHPLRYQTVAGNEYTAKFSGLRHSHCDLPMRNPPGLIFRENAENVIYI